MRPNGKIEALDEPIETRIEIMSMASFLKRLVIAIIVGVVIGVVLGFVAIAVSEELLFQVLLPIFVLTMVVGFTIFCIYIISSYVKFSNELKRLSQILNEDMDVDKYIEETEAAIANTLSKIYKLNFYINLAIGHQVKGERQKAINLMKTLKINGVNAVIKALYYNNLAYFYLENDELNEALQTYSKGEKFLDMLSKHPLYRSTVMHTKAVVEYCKGNLSLSEELLEKSKLLQHSGIHFETSVNVYLAKIYMRTGRTQQAKVLLDYNRAQRLFPNILEDTKALLAEIAETGKSPDP